MGTARNEVIYARWGELGGQWTQWDWRNEEADCRLYVHVHMLFLFLLFFLAYTLDKLINIAYLLTCLLTVDITAIKTCIILGSEWLPQKSSVLLAASSELSVSVSASASTCFNKHVISDTVDSLDSSKKIFTVKNCSVYARFCKSGPGKTHPMVILEFSV